MTKSIEKHHLAIVSNGYAYDKDTYRRHLLTSLLSGPNSVFNTKIQAIKGDVDSGYGYHASIDPAKLISSAKQQYVNIERCGEWNKVDPKDATIMALTTALKDVSDKPATSVPKSEGASSGLLMSTLEKWRTEFKGKTVEHGGITWTWCPHHKHSQGLYDGLYYSNHTPETHDQWRAGKKKGKKFSADTTASTAAPSAPHSKALKISETLKNALCTNLCVTEEDLNKIIDSAESEN